MTRYAGQLPAGFSWRSPGEAPDALAPAGLYRGDLPIGQVRRIGNGWVADADTRYFPVVPSVVVVPSKRKGQAWLSRWLRQRQGAVERACAALENAGADGPVVT